MIEDILKKRFQVREFNDIIPDKKIIGILFQWSENKEIQPYEFISQINK